MGKLNSIILSVLITICTAIAAFSQTIAFTYKGNNRDCIVHLPPSYNPSNPYPLVFLLHGYGVSAALQQGYSGMNPVADTAGFIVAYPNGVANAWDVVFSNSPVDDAGFINILLDSLIARYNVDTTRVYATGMSMGGFMTYRLGCEMTNRLAAIASVAGPTTDSVLISCANSRIIPVMHIHGTADATVQYEGDSLFHHVDSTIAFFVNKNGCGSPVVYNFPNTNTSDGCTVTSYYYCMGEDSAEVLFYKVTDGGHTWPGAIIPFDVTNQDINGSAEIWKFFHKHQRKTTPTSIPAPERTPPLHVFPNPAEDVLHVPMPETLFSNEIKVEIFDLTGKIHRSSYTGGQASLAIDLQGLPKGLYALRIIAGEQAHRAAFSIQ